MHIQFYRQNTPNLSKQTFCNTALKSSCGKNEPETYILYRVVEGLVHAIEVYDYPRKNTT